MILCDHCHIYHPANEIVRTKGQTLCFSCYDEREDHDKELATATPVVANLISNILNIRR